VEYSEAERKRILRAMRRIFTAIETRDRHAAAAAMNAFFAASLDYLDHTYPDVMARPLTWDDFER
jgi:DNA-binding GntR family transcriptional regulator